MCFRPPSVDEGGESVCASCGAANPPESTTCTSCGKVLLKVPEAASGRSAVPTVPGMPSAPKAPNAPKPPAAPKSPAPKE